MRTPRIVIGCLSFVLAMVVYPNAEEQTGTIFGVVRDSDGASLVGSLLTLSDDQTPPMIAETHSDKEGKYRFPGLRPGNYKLTVELNGFAAGRPLTIEVSPASTLVTTDFALTRAAVPTADKPKLTKSPIKFEAAGVRGLIDPGGYSAPAHAAAASGLIEGIADIKRSGNTMSSSASIDLACNREPELKEAVQHNPDKPEPNARLGQFYLAHDQAARALPFLQRARQLDSTNASVSRDLAVAWIKTGQFDSARELLSPLAAIEKNQPDIHALLARALEGLGSFKQASEEYQKASAEDPSEDNLFGVGYELILAGLPQEAYAAFQLGIAKYPGSITLIVGAGTAEFLRGNTSASVVFFLRATDLDPKDPRPYSFLASAPESSPEDNRKIQKAFKRYVDSAPNNAFAYYYYALSMWRNRGLGTACETCIEELLKHAIALDPTLAKAHLQIATLHFHRGDYEKAAREDEITIQLAPDMNEVHYQLSLAYKHLGKEELARREMNSFRAGRESESAHTAGAPTNIEQFMSVMDRPGARANLQAQCP